MQILSEQTTPLLEVVDKDAGNYPDVYFMHAYAKLYEKKEQGVAQTVFFQCPFGKINYTFLKREVPFLVKGKQYYDVTTAYGYGGPYIVESSDPKQLIEQFQAAFHTFCLKNDIVSEFVRFHLFENHDVKLHFSGEIQMIGHHIVRDLTKPLEADLHKSVAYDVRRASRKGITVSFDTTGESLPQFLDIYRKTMQRKAANEFYYFNEDFFQQLHEELAGKVLYAHAILDGKIISSFMAIVGEQYANGLFGGTLREYFSYNPATFLWHQMFRYLQEKGVQHFVLGGGYRGDDDLYKFKRKFDLQGDQPYFVGKRIHNGEVYQRLVTVRLSQGDLETNSSFFPLYRL